MWFCSARRSVNNIDIDFHFNRVNSRDQQGNIFRLETPKYFLVEPAADPKRGKTFSFRSQKS